MGPTELSHLWILCLATPRSGKHHRLTRGGWYHHQNDGGSFQGRILPQKGQQSSDLQPPAELGCGHSVI